MVGLSGGNAEVGPVLSGVAQLALSSVETEARLTVTSEMPATDRMLIEWSERIVHMNEEFGQSFTSARESRHRGPTSWLPHTR